MSVAVEMAKRDKRAFPRKVGGEMERERRNGEKEEREDSLLCFGQGRKARGDLSYSGNSSLFPLSLFPPLSFPADIRRRRGTKVENLKTAACRSQRLHCH